jgi:hypothetical protein
MNLARYLSAASAMPWTQYVWLGQGHTIDCDSWRNPRFDCAVLSSEHPTAPTPDFAAYFGDAVRVLWLLPMTGAERDDAAAQAEVRRTPMPPEDRWAEA